MTVYLGKGLGCDITDLKEDGRMIQIVGDDGEVQVTVYDDGSSTDDDLRTLADYSNPGAVWELKGDGSVECQRNRAARFWRSRVLAIAPGIKN